MSSELTELWHGVQILNFETYESLSTGPVLSKNKWSHKTINSLFKNLKKIVGVLKKRLKCCHHLILLVKLICLDNYSAYIGI